MRRSRFRGRRSALPIMRHLWPPVSNEKIRLCSRNGPSTLRTEMRSLTPATPGLSVQMPRTTISIRTPAVEAA
jgi:hypothetical protein